MKNQIKYLQNLFDDFLNDYGQVFMVVKHSDRTVIGERGFTEEEKERGIVLVFNRGNHRNLQWTEDGSIVVALGFGFNNKPENCFLHSDDIISIYSPDAKVIFQRLDTGYYADEPERQVCPTEGKIVSLNSFKEQKIKEPRPDLIPQDRRISDSKRQEEFEK